MIDDWQHCFQASHVIVLNDYCGFDNLEPPLTANGDNW